MFEECPPVRSHRASCPQAGYTKKPQSDRTVKALCYSLFRLVGGSIVDFDADPFNRRIDSLICFR